LNSDGDLLELLVPFLGKVAFDDFLDGQGGCFVFYHAVLVVQLFFDFFDWLFDEI